MVQMFYVRSSRALCPPSLLSRALPMRAACAATAPTPSRLPFRTWNRIICPPFDLQGAAFLSDANKLLIRCAWAGNSAFASAGYVSSWVYLGSCPPPSPSSPPSPPTQPPSPPSPPSPPCPPPSPLQPPFSATVSVDFTVSPVRTLAILQTADVVDDDLMMVLASLTTAYFNWPEDVVVTGESLEPGVADTIRLVATTASPSSTAIIQQNMADLTVEDVNALISKLLLHVPA
eukprot:scaffold38220_cov38-Phaeocystis_antarctica.AAC.2